MLGLDQSERIGVGLGLATALWVGASGLIAGGRSLPLVSGVLGAIAAVIVARRVALRIPVLVPSFLMAAPIIAAIVNRQLLFGDGPLGYSNASASLFVIAAAAGISLVLSLRGRLMRAAVFALTVLWIIAPWIVAGDTSTIVAMLLPVGVVFLTTAKARRAALVLGAAVVLAGLVVTSVLGARYEPTARDRFAAEVVDTTLGELRVILWSDALALVGEEPVFGVGPGRFSENSPTALERSDASWAHNEYLQMAAETGIVGGLLLLAIVVWAFARLWDASVDPRSVVTIIALGGVALNANIDYIWHLPMVPLSLALLVGAASSLTSHSVVHVTVPFPTQVAFAAPTVVWLLLLLPLELTDLGPRVIPNGVRPAGASGIEFVGEGGVVRSVAPPRYLYDALINNRALTLEMWVAAARLDQDGPARIVSASAGTGERNFTVGQDEDRLVLRLRTTTTNANGTNPHLELDGVFTSTTLRHIVIASEIDRTEVFVDGVMRWSGAGPGGELNAWVRDYPLLIGNETTGTRPWFGQIHSLSIYDDALGSAEVQKAYRLGEPTGRSSSSQTGPVPVASYDFRAPVEELVRDQSPARLGGVLDVPHELIVPRLGFHALLLGVGGNPVLRFSIHAAVFAFLAIPLTLALRRRFSLADATRVALGTGITVVLAVAAVRYVLDGAPSFLDVGGAASGTFAACVIVYRGGLLRSDARRDGAHAGL